MLGGPSSNFILGWKLKKNATRIIKIESALLIEKHWESDYKYQESVSINHMEHNWRCITNLCWIFDYPWIEFHVNFISISFRLLLLLLLLSSHGEHLIL
jgi:hypothetical protein